MLNSRAFQLSIPDLIMDVVKAIVVKIIADRVYSYGKALWKQYRPTLIEYKSRMVVELHFLACLIGIESLGVFTLVYFSRLKKSESLVTTFLVVLFALFIDATRKKPRTRFGSFFPIIKLL